ncbi:MAG TPA: hypothetical protein VEQ60_29085, partial [Longimicrobium sp.]|nr:hypothetical protein [Longimicrobium sp.]
VRYSGRIPGAVGVEVPTQTDRPQAPPASAVRADRKAQADGENRAEGENRAAADPVADQERAEQEVREARERAEQERRQERERIEQERREAQERAQKEQTERKPPEWEDPDPCAEPEIPEVWVDACTARRLVYSNPLLYDLIECFHGDLPHVVGLGWSAVTRGDRRVSWKEFITLLVGRKIAVSFDRRMRRETLNPHTFVVSLRVVERGTGFWVWKQVPCRAIEHRQEDRSGLRCDVAVFVPEQAWVEDELDGHNSEVAGGTDVEITLRGSLIMDEAGKALDGEYVGYRLPTGNGTQGGDFVDWFTVDARPPGEVGAARAARAETIEF